jgi:hypothetical protein
MAGKKASANKEEVKKQPRSKTPVKEQQLTKVSSTGS